MNRALCRQTILSLRVASGEAGILAVWLMGIPNGVERPASMLELLRPATSQPDRRRPAGAYLLATDQLSNRSAVCNPSRMAKTRHLMLLFFIFSTISGQINFGGGGSRRPSSSSGSQKPASSSSSGSGSRPSSGSSIQFSSDPQSPKEVVQGLQSKRQTLATVLKSQGVSPAVDVNIRGTLGTRRVGDQCTTPQRTAGSCQYIFARQCRCRLMQCNSCQAMTTDFCLCPTKQRCRNYQF